MGELRSIPGKLLIVILKLKETFSLISRPGPNDLPFSELVMVLIRRPRVVCLLLEQGASASPTKTPCRQQWGKESDIRKTEGSAVSYNCCFVFTRRRQTKAAQAEPSTVHYRLSCAAVPLACPSLCSLSCCHRSLRPAPAQWPPCEYRECPLPVILVSRSLCITEQVGAVAGRHSAEHRVFIWINGFQSCQISNVN